MGDHYGMLYQGQPDDAAPDELYTVPADYSVIVKDLEAFAYDGAGVDSITVWLVPDGETVGDEFVWIPTAVIDNGDRIEWSGSKCLQAGYVIVAQTGVGGILNLMISGLAADEAAP